MTPAWLTIERRDAPLILSVPHAGVDLLHYAPRFRSAWLARRDADWHLPELYDFAAGLGATIVRTSLSRSIIDVNRDPSGASLYPGQPTTELCPTTTFDGEPLYNAGEAPGAAEIAERRRAYFEPYHEALAAEIARLRAAHGRVALYDAHSIRSRIPRLFEGELPQFNLGTNGGRACSAGLRAQLAGILRRERTKPGRRRPLQGRLDHPRVRAPAGGRPRGADGAGVPRLYGRAGRDRPRTTGRPRLTTRRARAVTRTTLKAVLEALVAHAGRNAVTPSRQHARHPRPARTRAQRQELADRSAAAHADEQSRPRGRRAARANSSSTAASAAPRATGNAFDRIVATLTPAGGRRDAAGAVGQAGRRVPHPCRRAARADRQFQPRAALGDLGAFQRARSQGPDDVRPDDGRLLDLYRQPGHRAGHLRDLRRDRAASITAAISRAAGS